MIESKKINIIIAISLVFALIISIMLVAVGNIKKTSSVNEVKAEYTTKIFGSDIVSIEIIADEKDWQQMLDNAINEQYIMVDVIVNGTKFQSVGIRPKGNSSLTQVVNSDSDRYSFRLQFNEYIEGQTCFGLESFVVNNMLGDNTYMKEYVSYDLMQEIGVDAPHFGFADIKVNGENWGLYLAVELYNESYEQRVFNDASGMLYNVKSMEMGGNMGDNQPGRKNNNMMHNMPSMEEGENSRFQRPNNELQEREERDFAWLPDESGLPRESSGEDRPQGRIEGGMGRGSGGSLEYIDDNVESYSSIFNNVVGKGTEKDYKRVVEALKNLSEGNELEEYFDVDKILRYLAAHTIVVNLDSYSSSMAQNYYIYENDGKITILPWDYNLAWGGFQSGDASVINFPIDTPVSGVEMSSRPLIEKLFENTEYLKQYHSYLQELIDEYFTKGKFEEKVNTLDTLISDYVQNDRTAFCTYEEYKKAISTFITLGNLRAESVQGQLDGAVPSTSIEQNTNTDQLISAGDLELSDLGSMMGGQDKNSFSGGMQQNRNIPNHLDVSTQVDQRVGINDLIINGVFALMLIAALLYVVRFRKSY
ncbi:CotH kinase family protein [Tissierella sp. Yu-01]|uniref:CotH kinase family protein n=1 Tax=Tissierella sp. Yu-01 TaxID=3035694 RepID=UPI00240D689B|nr:CotH kinase family protein [Tissierella sp. Yu-01]WFA08006.1 CotH kinase family protein [Tissierella sp. Yu-01]